MNKTKRFPLRDVLTVTTGRLLTRPDSDGGNGIGALYEILGWMTNDSPFTHQLPRFMQECKPWLFRWFPELAKADELLPAFDAVLSRAPSPQLFIEDFLAKCATDLGCKAEYDIPRIPRDDHEYKHPIAELVEMRGTADGIVVVEVDE